MCPLATVLSDFFRVACLLDKSCWLCWCSVASFHAVARFREEAMAAASEVQKG